MKVKLFLLLLVTPLLTISLWTITSPVLAQNNISKNKVVVLGKDQIINDDYFAVGDNVTISGTVNGDAYTFGGTVVIEGTINGDLITAGGNVNVRGKISDDARVAGGQVIVSGEIGKNLTAAGGAVELTDSAKINGSIVIGSGNASIFAPIAKGATIGAGNITIGNTINGNVNAAVGNITLTPAAQIEGNLNYLSEEQAQIQPGAQVKGKTTHNIPQKPQVDQKTAKNVLSGLGLAFKIIGFISILVIGLVLIKFFPSFTLNTAQNLKQKFWLSLLVGFILTIVTPIAAIIFLITLIGVPFSVALVFALVAYLYLAKIFISLAIGQKISKLFNFKTSTAFAYLLGLSVYTFFTIIPVVGGLVSIIGALTGTGAIIITKRDFYLRLRTKKEL